MNYTENYGFDLPEGTDFVDVEHFNENARKVDDLLCPEYSEEKEIAELESGEKLSTAFGKLAKAVADYISHKEDETIHFTTEEREKLKNIAVGATKVIVDTALSSTSTNTVQNSTIYAALAKKIETSKIVNNLTTTATDTVLSGPMGKQLQDNKVDKISGKGLSTNDYTTTEKNKLAGIATGANKTTVDSTLSASSTNPVQNKIVTEQINQLLGLIATQLGSSMKWKNVTSCYMNGELGACYYICMPEADTTSNAGKEVLVVYNNGAIAKGKIVKSGSNYGLENPVTFLTDTTLPLVDKTTIQGGTNTLPYSNNGSIGYCVAPGYGYGAVLEISKSNTYATKYLILN